MRRIWGHFAKLPTSKLPSCLSFRSTAQLCI